MKNILLLLFLLALAEVPVFFFALSHLGAGTTLLWLLGTAALGAWVIYRGLHEARLGIHVRNQGPEEILRILGAFYHLMAGVLLISPGFLCDIIGLTLLLPPLRLLALKGLWKYLRRLGVLEEQSEGKYFRLRWSKTASTGSRKAPGKPASGRVKSYDYEAWEKSLPPDPSHIHDAEFKIDSSETLQR